MKQKLKSYKFWVALSGAVVILLRAICGAFALEMDFAALDGILVAVLGVFVAIGLIEKPATAEKLPEKTNAEEEKDKK